MLLQDDNYDIIFLDDMMPRMSGREVIKKLKQQTNSKTAIRFWSTSKAL